MVQLAKFFADTSKISDLEELMSLGIFEGITTNPLIVAKEAGGSEPTDYYKALVSRFPDMPVSIQLLDGTIDELLQQAREFHDISKNVVIKVPMFSDGRCLQILPLLTKEGIATNVTALMSAEQALAVLQSGHGEGPTYLSLFFNRIMDGKGSPVEEIEKTRAIIEKFGFSTQIIVGSIRKTQDIYDATMAGAHIVTIPTDRAREMIAHPQSTRFIEEAQMAWEGFIKEASSFVKSKHNHVVNKSSKVSTL